PGAAGALAGAQPATANSTSIRRSNTGNQRPPCSISPISFVVPRSLRAPWRPVNGSPALRLAHPCLLPHPRNGVERRVRMGEVDPVAGVGKGHQARTGDCVRKGEGVLSERRSAVNRAVDEVHPSTKRDVAESNGPT